jgi:hypothetical protein
MLKSVTVDKPKKNGTIRAVKNSFFGGSTKKDMFLTKTTLSRNGAYRSKSSLARNYLPRP